LKSALGSVAGRFNILQYGENLLASQIFRHIFGQVLQSTVFKTKSKFTKLLQRKSQSETVFKKMQSVVFLAVCNILQYGETLLARQIFWHIFSQVLQSTVFKIKVSSTKLLQFKSV